MFYLTVQRTWYGLEEVRPFWDFIQTACRYLPNNCINSIVTLENVKSTIGKVTAIKSIINHIVNILQNQGLL